MRKMAGLRVLLRVLVFCTLCYANAKEEEAMASQNQKLHELVKTMLGFKDSPGSGKTNVSRPALMGEDSPKYMLDLYERFKNNKISKGQLSGNTVRSIHATTETVNGMAMFVFNLTSIMDSEDIISAEIHLYKRRKSRYNRKADLEVVLHEVAPHYVVENGKISLRTQSYGWQWFDVTDNVKSCLVERRLRPHAFALNFKAIKPKGHVSVLDLKRFTHHHSVPFLVVYSNDTQVLSFDQLERLSTNVKAKESIDAEVKDKLSKARTPGRTKRSFSDNTADGPYHASRSLFTNEIPEDPDEYRRFPIGYSVQTHPGMLQTRKESRHKMTDARLIPYPGDSKDSGRGRGWRKRKRNRKNKNKKGRRKNNKLDLPKDWDDLENTASSNSGVQLCSKKKLVVDLNDIGWGEWIIAPKSFEANFCAGMCPFPLTKRLRPSNHATIQSLVHAVGIYPDVPAPCCVPDTMSSLSLLYFDEDANVVLKNYPGMTVETCACR